MVGYPEVILQPCRARHLYDAGPKSASEKLPLAADGGLITGSETMKIGVRILYA